MEPSVELQQQFSRLAKTLEYPVYIVSTRVGGEHSGCLIGFGSQCSVKPPRFLACLSKKNHTFGIALRAERLAVHVVEAGNAWLAELFGGETGDDVDKFAQVRWKSVDGMPVLEDCQRWFIGTVIRRVDFGDHVGHLLEPIRVSLGMVSGQLNYQQAKAIRPGHDP